MAQSTQGVGCEPSFLLIRTLGGSRQCLRYWGSLPPMGETRLEFLAPGSSMIQPWLLQACGVNQWMEDPLSIKQDNIKKGRGDVLCKNLPVWPGLSRRTVVPTSEMGRDGQRCG